jgi:hypothetical protein
MAWRTFLCSGLLLALATAPAAADDGEKIPRFAAKLVDLSGEKAKPADFDSHEAKQVVAYLFLGTGCPATRAYVERIKALERAWHPKGVRFVHLYPNRTDTGEEKVEFHKERGFAGPMVDDREGRIAKLLGAKRTTEVVLVSKDGRIFYRGGLDDSRDPDGVGKRYVAAALEEHLAGKPVTIARAPVFA